MRALGAGVAAEFDADALDKFRVPGRSKRNAAAVGRRRAVIPQAHRPVCHGEPRHAETGHAAEVKEVDAAEEIDFFLERHLAKDGVDPRLQLLVGRIAGGLGKHRKHG